MNSFDNDGRPEPEEETFVAENILPLIYDDLRRLAADHLAKEQPGQTLQPTALVNEVYLRLLGKDTPVEWHNRSHFFAAAATVIRRILIDSARRKRSHKRGGGYVRQKIDPSKLPDLTPPAEDMLALDAALNKLAVDHAQAAELVHLRYFAGLPLNDAATVLGISTRTANRLWAFARAWLRREIDGTNPLA